MYILAYIILILVLCITTDRTIAFIQATIEYIQHADSDTGWKTISGIYARVRRVAIGIMLCLGPFNYPFNGTLLTILYNSYHCNIDP